MLNTTYSFSSTVHTYANEFQAEYPTEVVKNEPMFFNANLAFIYENGGPITKAFVDNLPHTWKNEDTVWDSRVHMLMPGWFPCIPGFHHDDVPRSSIDQQPNYDDPEYRSKHIIGLVNGDICPTEFALGDFNLPGIVDGEIIYKHWHPLVVQHLINGQAQSFSVPSGRYIEFDDRSFHQGTPAIKGGWRWFIRGSKDTDRTKNCTNEIRRQVQVYLEHPMEGW